MFSFQYIFKISCMTKYIFLPLERVSFFAISLERGMVPSPKIAINLFIRSYTVKENHISTTVSEILWYRQTDIWLLYYKDVIISNPQNKCNSNICYESEEVWKTKFQQKCKYFQKSSWNIANFFFLLTQIGACST